MTTQGEPDGGVWQDRNGDVWTQLGNLEWESTASSFSLRWREVAKYGPLVPLIPDPGWEQDGEPIVCRVVRRNEDVRPNNDGVHVESPTGRTVTWISDSDAKKIGLPVPPEPEPFSVVSLGDETWWQDADGTWLNKDRRGGDAHHTSPMGMALSRIKELEANSQSATSESQSGSRPDPDLVPVMLSREDAESLLSGWGPEYRAGRLSAACRSALKANPGGES